MKPQGYYDLLEAFNEAGCAVCRVLQSTNERFIMYLLADRVLDEPTLQALRARRGLCNQHISALMQRRGIVLPLAIFYQAAMDEIVQIMAEIPPVEHSPRGLRHWLGKGDYKGADIADRLESASACLICADTQAHERRLIDVLCKYLPEDAVMTDTYQRSQGLCLPHLLQVLRAAQKPAAIDLLICTQRRLWKQGGDELDEFIAKLNHARRDETKGREGGSLLRAVAWMAGLGGIFGQDPRNR